MFIVVLQNIIYDKKYYHNQFYNPENMIQFTKTINDHDAKSYSIKEISVYVDKSNKPIRNQRNDHFATRASSYFCYQPIFGYNLEKFPKNNLVFNKKTSVQNNLTLITGDIGLNKSTKKLNFLNPTCFLFPTENDCKPGELFNQDQALNLSNFLSYKKIIFKKNIIQNISDYVSLISFLSLLIFVFINLYFFLTNLKKYSD